MNTSIDELTEVYRTMCRMRAFDDHVDLLFREGQLKGTAHSYAGMEAVGAGVTAKLRAGDYLSSYHRGHGHAISRGLDVVRMAHELYGNPEGYSRGKGGSMHITDVSLGMLGANGIIGAGIPIALGAALAARAQGGGAVAVAFFGDGGANAGVFFECLNMAAIWRAPMIFVCENNGVALTVETETVTAGRIADRSIPFGVPGEQFDGTDIDVVLEAAERAVTRARQGEGPTLLEFQTVRFGTHSTVSNVETRDREWLQEGRATRDPLLIARRKLLHRTPGLSEGTLDEIRASAVREMVNAFDIAAGSPRQVESAAWEDVYA